MFRDYTNYEIYEDGRIWSYKRNKFLKPKSNGKGYQQVKLSDNEGKVKNYQVHRVVYEAVTGEPIPEGMQINHRSEVKTENMISNLELVSPKQNINYGSGIERRAKAQSKQVGAFKKGELAMTFQSLAEAQRNGFSQSGISECCNGKRKTHKGYEWRYL